MFKPILFGAIAAASFAQPASAETIYSIYGGWQTSPHSHISGIHPDTSAAYDTVFGWEGKSFEMPPYYGARAEWWNGDWSTQIEFTHSKVYAVEADRNAVDFDKFEFTDGHNIFTVNRVKRWDNALGNRTVYAGAGAGIALPHVDVLSDLGEHTYGYQLTGPALKLLAGARQPIRDNMIAFAEYQFTVSWNEGTLTGGGTFDTRLITNALNIGIGWEY
ncbi:MAG: lipid A oxidase [Paracoccaceae bacterium]|nr:lipid A oxidase [Paracoccaceae bacterium]MDG1738288.1 lipid A oxidase [Paracoccaceae bacterium]MDG2260560.1 lipid A oxidase [Paracoccaceae bacterium]